MAARAEIEQLVHRYAELVDSGDFEGVANLFAEGEILGPDGATIASGYDAVLDLYRRSVRLDPQSGTPGTRHLVTNLIVELSADRSTANGRCYFTVLQVVPRGGLQPIISGRYRDQFRRAETTWRFRSRQMIPDMLGNVEHHLAPEFLASQRSPGG